MVVACRRGRKCGEMPLNADRNRCACRIDLKRFIARSRCRVGWWEFSARLFKYFDRAAHQLDSAGSEPAGAWGAGGGGRALSSCGSGACGRIAARDENSSGFDVHAALSGRGSECVVEGCKACVVVEGDVQDAAVG